MSHFTVLVIGDNAEEQLAPYEESPKEGSKYLKFKSVEKEYRKKYETEKVDVVTMPDGTKLTKYSKKLEKYWKRSGFGISSGDKFEAPEGATMKSESVKAVYTTFDKYMKDWAGYEKDEKTGEYGYMHNPKAKWDWYSLGGRWTGFLKLKNRTNKGSRISEESIVSLATQYGTTVKIMKERIAAIVKGDFNELFEIQKNNPIRGGYQLEETIKDLLTVQYDNARVGEPGLGTKVAEAGYVDSARIGDIDFEGMIREAGIEARQRYEKLEGLLGGTIPQLEYRWSDMIDDKNLKFNKLSIDEKRAIYHNQSAKLRIEEARKNPGLSKDDQSLLTWVDLEQYQMPKDKYVSQAENSALSTFAVVRDGKWFEKGRMGWFGMAFDEMTQVKWDETFISLLRGLPEDTVISVYDCHI